MPSTPATAGRAQLRREEMHPSKAHQSTKKEDAGMSLGFSDIGHPPESLATPSKVNTPASSNFDFRCDRPTSNLGPDAQQLRAEIREEAQRIKNELAAQKERDRLNGNDDSADLHHARKIAHPKGKAGRFSDVHMADFKKMDSIADHPSLRAQAAKGTPATKSIKRTPSKPNLGDQDANATKSPSKADLPAKKGLKRTQSKANLNDQDANAPKSPTKPDSPAKKGLKRTQSKANLNDQNGNAPKSPTKSDAQPSRLENEAPAKRARKLNTHDTSSARPGSRDAASKTKSPSKPATPAVARSANFLDSITTPTQASLARTANARKPASQIPAMPRTASKIAMTPRLAKSATTNNLSGITKSESSNRFTDRMKSIMRRPRDASEKPADDQPSATPSIKSPSKQNLDKELPAPPATPKASQLPRSNGTRHVNFTPKTILKNTTQVSPSPMKSGIPRSKSFTNLNSAYSALPAPPKPAEEKTEKPAEESAEEPDDASVKYPELPETSESPSTPARKTAPAPPQAHPPHAPGNFTFASHQQIKFGTPPRSLGFSPGQASIRKVRQSVLSKDMPGSFPEVDKENDAPPLAHGLSNKKRARAASPIQVDDAPAVAHGLSNKKRARVASPDNDGVGMDVDARDADEEPERAPKKRKGSVAEEGPPTPLAKKAPKSGIPSPVKRGGGMRMSRLMQLATPKKR